MGLTITRPAPPDPEMERQSNRASWITTQLIADVLGPTHLAVKASECRTDSEQLGFVTAQYVELWRAYRRLAVRSGEVEALVEANQLE